jgi:glycosyltransferase involved in cell wall biosynthesis
MENRIKVLWLPAWYPSKQDFLSGDFIDRHAKAVSRISDVVVLFVTKDFALPYNTKNIEIEENENLIICRGYYNCSNKLGYIGKLWSVCIYYQLLFKLYKIVNKKQVKFDLVHVHISQRQGLLALFLKWKKGIKYLITEQNSWFMPVGNKYFTKSILLKILIRSNFKNASGLHVVSNSLGNELKKKFGFIKNCITIPNVVDSSIFYYKDTFSSTDTTHFFAITGDTFHKNTDGLIRAFANFIKEGYKGILHIAGPNIDELKLLAQKLSLKDYTKFYGPISNKEVANIMQQTDAFVFFTRYETFGCVMAEALSCGKPVIATKIPVMEESLTEHTNALFVVPEDEDDLTKKLIYFAQHKSKFKGAEFSVSALAKYNYSKISEDFLALYISVL